MRRTATTLAVLGLLAAPAAAQAGQLQAHATAEQFCDGTFRVDATAGPKGKRPKGQVTCYQGFEGPVVGLKVTGNVALVTFRIDPLNTITYRLVDGPDSIAMTFNDSPFMPTQYPAGLNITVSH